MSYHRFRFSLRFFALITIAVGGVAGVVGTQIKGRIQRECDRGFFTDLHRTRVDFGAEMSGNLAYLCPTKADAGQLVAEFDHGHFHKLVAAELERMGERDRLANSISVNCGQSGEIFYIKYDFPRWGRYRLDARQMRYVFDLGDPVALSRTDAMLQAILQAGKAFAESNPMTVSWVHNLN